MNATNQKTSEKTTSDTSLTSPAGTEFEVRSHHSLYFVHMKRGGRLPSVCDERFTSYNAAMKALQAYLSQDK